MSSGYGSCWAAAASPDAGRGGCHTCCLPGLGPQEESNEFGGTFICNGIERIIRMLVQVRGGGGQVHRRGSGCTPVRPQLLGGLSGSGALHRTAGPCAIDCRKGLAGVGGRGGPAVTCPPSCLRPGAPGRTGGIT